MSLPENIAEPSFLVQLMTVDTDYDEEGGVTFSIPAEKYREIVSVDPYTGTSLNCSYIIKIFSVIYIVNVEGYDNSVWTIVLTEKKFNLVYNSV